METLRAYLKATKRTQKWLAAEIGVTEKAVSAWMVQNTMPRPEQMLKVQKATDGAVPVTAWFAQAVE